MKRIITHKIFFLMLMCFVSSIFVGQVPERKRDKIDALRVAFISKKLNLTAREAETFWPLYDEMNDKLNANRLEFRRKYNNKTNYDFASDAEAEAYLDAELLLRQREYELYKVYFDKFKRILSVKKVAALRHAEEEFKKEIIKSIREN